MNEQTVQEPCPRCGKLHARGDYVTWPDKTVSPSDVRCECGLELRWSVPFFKQTASGGLWRVLRLNETGLFREPK